MHDKVASMPARQSAMRRWVGLVTVLLVGGCAAARGGSIPAAVNHGMSSAQTHERSRDAGGLVTIDADALERFDEDRRLVFTGKVVVAWLRSWRLYADRVEVNLDETASRIFRATALGNVRIAMSDCRKGQADRVEYYDDDERILLSGNARVWRDQNVVSGKKLVLTVPRFPWGFDDCSRTGDKPPAPRRPEEASSSRH